MVKAKTLPKKYPNKHSEEEYEKGLRYLRRKFPAFKELSNHYKPSAILTNKRSPYEVLVRSISHQQLHGKAAETILGRFIALYAPEKFPAPEDILKTPVSVMRGCGFSESKVRAIKDIALKTKEGIVPTKREVAKLSNEEIIDRLTVIHGVGQWTVEMLLLFQLGRLDVWPVDDFGIRRGYQIWMDLKVMPTAKELREEGNLFAPYQSILCLYLCQLSNQTKS